MTHYVLGLMFSHDKKRILLMRKNRPDYQKGKLNGVGGKVFDEEAYFTAMQRECREETGIDQDWWDYCGSFVKAKEYTVHIFMCDCGIFNYEDKTDEGVLEIHDVELVLNRSDIMPNLKWIIPMALAPDKPYITALENQRI